MNPAGDLDTLVDALLREQQALTAVDRFALHHSPLASPHAGALYSALLPSSPPGPGHQYAFEVDMDSCSGCKACVTACHSLNGLEDGEFWRDTGLIRGSEPNGAAYQQTITSACHHCADPACLEGCPVEAYHKDPRTGIVRHRDDQCIGCQYCVLKCPYDVPKYSEKLGIVRKCDMCSQRLAVGEAPACVQACPGEAIRIRIVETEALPHKNHDTLVPGAFDSAYTRPSTIYLNSRPIPGDASPADAETPRAEPPHWPLAFMLLLTQAALGTFAARCIPAFDWSASECLALSLSSWALLHAGLAASLLHLGRPLGAWRFFLGLRTSWMSREILAFGLFSAAGTLSAAVDLLLVLQHTPPNLRAWVATAAIPIHGSTFAMATTALGCSAMIYIDTHRILWRAAQTFPRFLGTSLLLGSAATLCLRPQTPGLALGICLLQCLLLAWELPSPRQSSPPLRRPPMLVLRVISALCGALSALLAPLSGSRTAALLALGSCALGQLLERHLFFTCVRAHRMPGIPSR